MTKHHTDAVAQAAIHNLAVLLLRSSPTGTLTIEYKQKARIGTLSNGVDADELIDNLSRSLGVRVPDQSVKVAHINGSPIGDEMLPELMKAIGELYLGERRGLELQRVA